MNYLSKNEAMQLVCDIGRKMYQRGFVSANDGNITIRISDTTVVATPTGVSKGDLTPDKLLVCDFDGNVLEGTWKPTSELPMHLQVYKEDNTIMSTAHAHPTFLVVMANLGADLDMALTPATTAISGRIPCVPYCNPGSVELAETVGKYVKDYNVVTLANHGPIAWGRTPIEAWYTLEDAESYAKIAVIQKFLVGSYRPISKPQIDLLAATHDVTINPNRLVKCPETTNNEEAGISFETYRVPGVTLNEETINAIATRVAEILR